MDHSQQNTFIIFIEKLFLSCLSLETNLTVSYLGPEGTYSEIATNKFFGKVLRK